MSRRHQLRNDFRKPFEVSIGYQIYIKINKLKSIKLSMSINKNLNILIAIHLNVQFSSTFFNNFGINFFFNCKNKIRWDSYNEPFDLRPSHRTVRYFLFKKKKKNYRCTKILHFQNVFIFVTSGRTFGSQKLIIMSIQFQQNQSRSFR